MSRYLKVQVLFGILLLTGCSLIDSKPVSQPAMHDFGLSYTQHADNSQLSTKAVVTVNAPTWLWDNRIRFRLLYNSPTQIQYYGLDQWIAPPPELFEQALTERIGKFNATLNIHLLDFEQQFISPKQARVVLRFSVDVSDGSNSQLLAYKLFSLEQSTISPDADGAVAGYRALVSEAGEQIQAWLFSIAQRSD